MDNLLTVLSILSFIFSMVIGYSLFSALGSESVRTRNRALRFLAIAFSTFFVILFFISFTQDLEADILLFNSLIANSFVVSAIGIWAIIETYISTERFEHSFSDVPDEEDQDFTDYSQTSSDGSEYEHHSERSGTNQHNGGQGPAEDYAEMMREALAVANTVSDAKAAARAEWMERKAKEPGLNKRTRQHYEMVAMLLRERAKGFQGRPDHSPPSDEEIRTLLLQKN